MRDSGTGGGLDRARAALRERDPVMRALIDAKPDLDYDAWRRTLPVENLFQALLFQIVGQQISVSAANAIYARLRTLFPGDRPDRRTSRRFPLTHCGASAFRRVRRSTRKTSHNARLMENSTG